MGKTKGLTAVNYVIYVTERASANELEEIKRRMGPAAREALFGAPILAMSLVDYGAVMQLLIAADQVIGKGDLRLLREASQHNQRQNFNSVYRALLPLFSPEFLIGRASKLWQRYHDTGSLTTARLSPTKVALTLHDYPDIPEHHAPEIEGAFEALLIMAGVKLGGMVHTKCANRKDPLCEWEISWSA